MALSIDATATGTGVILNDGDSVTTGAFSTVEANTLVLALVAYNGDIFLDLNLTGADLDWQLVDQETTISIGGCYAYMAWAPSTLTDVTATFTVTGANSVAASTLLSVIAISGVDTSSGDGWSAIGASDGASGHGVGNPSVSLSTTLNGSWIFGVGNDTSSSTARTLGTGQTLIGENPYVNGSLHQDSWCQRLDAATPDIGTNVTIDDSAPTNTQWKMLAIEVLPPDTRTDPIVTWDTPSPILTTTPISSVQLSATANVAGSFEYSVAIGDFLSSGLQTISAFFTPDDPGSYRSAFAFVTIPVSIPDTPTFMQGVAHAAIGGSPLSVTFDAPVQLNSTIICVIAHNYRGCDPGISSASDTLGNAYTRSGSGQTPSPGSNQFLWIYTAPVTTSGPCTVTITYACGGCRFAFFVEATNVDTTANPYDGSNVHRSTSSPATSGSVTTTADRDLVLSAWSGDAAPEWTEDSGTIVLTDDGKSALQWQIQETAGAVNPTAEAGGLGSTYGGLGFTIAFRATPPAAHDYTQDLTDSVSLGEALIRATGKHALEALSLAEVIRRAIDTSRTESITVSDAIAKRPDKNATDTITLAESFAKQPKKSLLDSIGLSDLYSRTLNKLYSFVDSISISEIFSATKARLLEFADSFAILDSIAKASTRTFASSITLVEQTGKATGRTLSDAFALSDLFATTKARVIALVDSLEISDSLSKATQRIHTDVLTLIDLLDLSGAKLLNFLDSLDIADSIKIATGKVVTEAFTLSDSISRAATVTFRDTLNILDSIASSVHQIIKAVRKFLVEVWRRTWAAQTETRLWSVDQPLRKWSTSNAMIHTQKDPAASETFSLDWSAVVADDPITDSTWTTPTGITQEEDDHTSTTTSVKLSGGTLGRIYSVSNQVTLTSGEIKLQHLAVTIAAT